MKSKSPCVYYSMYRFQATIYNPYLHVTLRDQGKTDVRYYYPRTKWERDFSVVWCSNQIDLLKQTLHALHSDLKRHNISNVHLGSD